MSVHARTSPLAAVLVTFVFAACGASAQSTESAVSTGPVPGVATTPCGKAGAEVLARTAGWPAVQIYTGELAGQETKSDRHEVESYAPLLSAMESGEPEAIRSAVTQLVYSGTHIVRLRVSKGSTVLSDVGGPYIIAPVAGTLRSHGRTVGHYLLSVQDDVGYVKLETRFVGAPLVMRSGSQPIPVAGLLTPGPANIPTLGPVRYRGVNYEAYSFNASRFPSGPLRISLLLPVSSSLASQSCVQIRRAELESIAHHLSLLFKLSPKTAPSYVELTEGLTQSHVYVRQGSRQLAGTTNPGPSQLPNSGSVNYRGVSYEVSSFTAPSSLGTVRIYQLVTP